MAGEPIGFFSACLNQIAATESAYYQDYAGGWNWVDLFPPVSKVTIKKLSYRGIFYVEVA